MAVCVCVCVWLNSQQILKKRTIFLLLVNFELNLVKFGSPLSDFSRAAFVLKLSRARAN